MNFVAKKMVPHFLIEKPLIRKTSTYNDFDLMHAPQFK